MKRADHVVLTAEALANLNTYHAVIALMEGGLLYGPRTHASASKIIRIAKAAACKELAEYDRHAELSRGKDGAG